MCLELYADFFLLSGLPKVEIAHAHLEFLWAETDEDSCLIYPLALLFCIEMQTATDFRDG